MNFDAWCPRMYSYNVTRVMIIQDILKIPGKKQNAKSSLLFCDKIIYFIVCSWPTVNDQTNIIILLLNTNYLLCMNTIYEIKFEINYKCIIDDVRQSFYIPLSGTCRIYCIFLICKHVLLYYFIGALWVYNDKGLCDLITIYTELS